MFIRDWVTLRKPKILDITCVKIIDIRLRKRLHIRALVLTDYRLGPTDQPIQSTDRLQILDPRYLDVDHVIQTYSGTGI